MAVCECRGIEPGERARWFWMRTVPSNIILWERRARTGPSVLLRAVFASRKNFHHQKEGTNEPENLKGERVVALSKKERKKFSFRTNPIAASRAKILASFSSPWCSDIEQFNKSLPGHRLRHAVVHQPNRFPNPPIYGRKTSLGRHHRSRRLPTIRLRGQILRVPLLTGRGTRVQGGF